ncbi:hypothetical protein PF003_g37642 [Phytophthora fragariae]|uniref:Uncharacterized protein n=1 Tax=Phytophthora fragariae TaxID=53985 RepID=A0A6A3FPA0_9STRA|nr:hypothetical protein PF003_g37642 [Phytophthora fragariae]KAE8943558.1 hypothetical protein PF009_g6727 [Phytophthora fragariae]
MTTPQRTSDGTLQRMLRGNAPRSLKLCRQPLQFWVCMIGRLPYEPEMRSGHGFAEQICLLLRRNVLKLKTKSVRELPGLEGQRSSVSQSVRSNGSGSNSAVRDKRLQNGRLGVNTIASSSKSVEQPRPTRSVEMFNNRIVCARLQDVQTRRILNVRQFDK